MLRRGLVPALAAVLLSVGASTAAAQAADERAQVLAVVKRLFDGMRAGDSAMVRSVFHPRAQLATAVVRQGANVVQVDDMEGFVKAVGTPHEEVWDERTRNDVVHIDGTLAVVWTEYAFFIGPKFSHCGVDAFQMAKEGGDWKIVALADTRRRQGCQEEGW